MKNQDPRPSRRLALALAGALTIGGLAIATTATQLSSALPEAPACPSGEWVRTGPGPAACVHADEAPPGIDVTDPVSTRELRSREGASEQAIAVAAEMGAPIASAAAVSSPAVACDGDGSAGYRVQALYVVESDDPNRFSDLLPNLRLWAAGADDVVNRSAALTGGARNLRYVTQESNGACVPQVLNVTVPPGSLASFNSSISAIQAQGHTLAHRKYMMWTDTSALCGVATVYPYYDDTSVTNLNNGSNAQYARIDRGCWGLGSTSGQHSVEAHEIVHTLGAVAATAPHGTKYGHCSDESDAMCYNDGSGIAMKQICPPEGEYLLDCNSDDYFSTAPVGGSWLATHWNSANSRFLIGAGTNGGSTVAPTMLGATVAVNNPAVSGLPTQASVSPAVPQGRTITSVAWKSARADCTFTDPRAASTEVTCNAGLVTPTTVTVTVTDSSGASKTITSPLTFSPEKGRAVSMALSTADQPAATVPVASVCTSGSTALQAWVVDTASGLPVKGAGVTFARLASGATTPVTVATAPTTGVAGARATLTTAVPVTVSARSTLVGPYAAGTAVTQRTSLAKCTPALTASSTKSRLLYGETTTVSGTLTRSVVIDGENVEVPVPLASLPVTLTTSTTSSTGVTTTKVATLVTVRTGVDGTFTTPVKPLTDGTLAITLPPSAAYVTARQDLGPVEVVWPTTALSGSVNRSDVGYGEQVVVTGSLTKTLEGVVSPLSATTVTARVTPPGKAPVTLGSGRTTLSGGFSIPAALRVSGTLSLHFAGAAGLPAASVTVGPVVAGTWTPTLTLTSSATTAPYGTTVTFSGTARRAYGATEQVAPALPVKLYFTPAGSTTAALVASGSTTSAGVFTIRTAARRTGTFEARVVATPGYVNAVSGTRSLTVP